MPGQGTKLKRSLGLPMITLYGVGTTVGAGIYVLIGKVSGSAGLYAPLSFLVAAVVAAFSVFAFAELSSRLPRSAGEAVYCHRAFGSRGLALAVGLVVALAGLVSAAAIARGFVGYLGVFWSPPADMTVALLILGLGGIAAWGISQSIFLAACATLVEIGGLLLVIWGGRAAFIESTVSWQDLLPPVDPAAWGGILAGALLAFYAFIGFEDMVNVAEEVKDSRRTLPRAIVLTLIITTACYLLLAVVAVRTLPQADLITAEAPLALLFERSTGLSPAVIAVIAMIAVLNGALVQIIMASRVLYGLSREGWIPQWIGRVHPLTRTPLTATALVTLAAVVFALWLPLVTLAKVTATLTLTLFAVVNLALLVLKRDDPHPEGVTLIPAWLPLLGFVSSAAFATLAVAGIF